MTQRPSGSGTRGALIVSRLRRRSRFCRSPEALLRPDLELTHDRWTPPALVRAKRNEAPRVEVVVNVCFWHIADIDADDEHVRFWG